MRHKPAISDDQKTAVKGVCKTQKGRTEDDPR